MRISDWSSDVCSSDLAQTAVLIHAILMRLPAFYRWGGHTLRATPCAHRRDVTCPRRPRTTQSAHSRGPLCRSSVTEPDMSLAAHDVVSPDNAGRTGGCSEHERQLALLKTGALHKDRKSTRLNSSH